ncbi:MAG TPA: alpha/beta fold hydrolase [Acidimicrobiales bacterium]
MLTATAVAVACVISAQATAAGAVTATGHTTAQAPRDPVIVVMGTGSFESPLSILDYNPLLDRLRADGYRVYGYPLPGGGLGDMRQTSASFARFVDTVLAETGARRVDLVGHSQGGLISRYYIKFLGGAHRVDSLVGLGVPHYGSTLANLAMLFGLLNCLGFPFCQQSETGSEFLRDLNGDDDTFGSVRYTNIATTLDLIVLPYTNSFQRSPGAVNVTVQDQCPLRIVEHITLASDSAVYSGIVDALEGRPITLECGLLPVL